jgi:ABC-type phosphate transport system substrate-binding protein
MRKVMKTNFKAIAALALLGALSGQANAEVVVVVGAKSSATTLTADQVSQIFLGKSTTHTPLDQAEANPIRSEFYKKATGKDAAQVKAVWSKLVFTGKASMPKEVGGSSDVKRVLSSDSNAIGYIEKSAVDSSVKAVLTIQ